MLTLAVKLQIKPLYQREDTHKNGTYVYHLAHVDFTTLQSIYYKLVCPKINIYMYTHIYMVYNMFKCTVIICPAVFLSSTICPNVYIP